MVVVGVVAVNCSMCGQRVKFYTGEKGTFIYEPLVQDQLQIAVKGLIQMKANPDGQLWKMAVNTLKAIERMEEL